MEHLDAPDAHRDALLKRCVVIIDTPKDKLVSPKHYAWLFYLTYTIYFKLRQELKEKGKPIDTDPFLCQLRIAMERAQATLEKRRVAPWAKRKYRTKTCKN